MPFAILVTPANEPEYKYFEALYNQLPSRPLEVMADAAYDKASGLT